jgi:hypothetical protein
MTGLTFERSWEQDDTLRATPLDPTKLWYVLKESGQAGPLTLQELGHAMEGGQIPEDSLLWQEGFKDWLPAGSLPQLKALLGSFPPPPDDLLSDAVTVHDVQRSLQKIALTFEAEQRAPVPAPPRVPEVDPIAPRPRATSTRIPGPGPALQNLLDLARAHAGAATRVLERSPRWVWAALGAGGASALQVVAWLWWLSHHATH